MATSMSLQKRKRADSTLDSITVLTLAEEAAIQATIDKRHGKPSNIENNSDDLDIELSNEVELEDSTLFWVQRKLFISSNETIILEKPLVAQRDQRLVEQTSKFRLIFLFLYYNISILRLFLASRGSYNSKLIKESAKPLRTQQMHVYDQRARDT